MQKTTKTSALLKGLVSLALIWFLLQRIDVSSIIITIKSCKWQYLFLALCLFALSKIISAIRLNLFFSLFDIHVSWVLNLKLYLLGMFYNLFLPGGIGGDGYKVFFLRKKYNAKTGSIIKALLLDRVSGLFMLCYLLILLSLKIDYFIPIRNYLAAVLLMSLIVFYFMQIKFFLHHASSFLCTTILSASVQTAQLVSAYFILCALSQSPDYTPYLFVFLVSSVIAVIPFTIGGIGARELTFLIGSQWLRLDTNISIAVSLIFFSITAAVSSCGIIYTIKGPSVIEEKK